MIFLRYQNPVTSATTWQKLFAVSAFIMLALAGIAFHSVQAQTTSTTIVPHQVNQPAGRVDPTFLSGSGLNLPPAAIATQSDGKIIVGGNFTTFNNTALPAHLTRFNPDSSVDTSFNMGGSGANAEVRAIAVQADGKLVIGGRFTTYNGTPAFRIARLNPDGSLDSTFKPSGSGLNDTVLTIVLQTDGKILIGGGFTSYNGISANYFTRLNADGSLDTAFNTNTVGTDYTVRVLAIQSDGKIVVGGAFDGYLLRFNPDGSSDDSFNTNAAGLTFRIDVYSIVMQADGKIVVGGLFSKATGAAANYLLRLNTDGSLDSTFNPAGSGPDIFVYSLLVQPDNKILVGGYFHRYNNAPANFVTRLKADGSLDTAFNAGDSGANDEVDIMALQGDGKVVLGGLFNFYNGASANHLTRLNPDGSRDSGAFNGADSGANKSVLALATQSDGKIILGGTFDSYNGAAAGHIVRLNPDGTRDTSFDPAGSGSDHWVTALTVETNGKIVVGGYFQSYDDVAAPRILRLNPDGTVDKTFRGGVDDRVFAVAAQSDGKILAGGAFIGGAHNNGITRFNLDGGIDSNFNAAGSGIGRNSVVSAITVQADGKILVGGNFDSFNDQPVQGLVRLNGDGSVDSSFKARVGYGVYSLVVQPDGKILVGGTSYNGITRLNPDGTLDQSFSVGSGPNAAVNAIALEPDGKIVLGGNFTSFDNTPTGYIVRLNPDGSRDTSFDPGTGASDNVNALTLQNGSEVIAGGDFTAVDTTTRDHVARLYGGVDLSVVKGSSQAAFVGTTFAQPLAVRVTDGPVPLGGAVVSFTFPATEPSGSFPGGSPVYTGTSDSSGVVTSPVFSAGSVPGNYSVVATSGGANPVSFKLSNIASCSSVQVTSNRDDGSCGTLRAALVVAATSSGGNSTVSIGLEAGSVISLTQGLNVPAGVTVTTTARCGTGPGNTMLPPVILQGTGINNGVGLRLSANDKLYGLWVRGFSGVQIKAPVGSATLMQCVKASKL